MFHKGSVTITGQNIYNNTAGGNLIENIPLRFILQVGRLTVVGIFPMSCIWNRNLFKERWVEYVAMLKLDEIMCRLPIYICSTSLFACLRRWHRCIFIIVDAVELIAAANVFNLCFFLSLALPISYDTFTTIHFLSVSLFPHFTLCGFVLDKNS